jgi:hypothetical protein
MKALLRNGVFLFAIGFMLAFALGNAARADVPRLPGGGGLTDDTSVGCD